MVDARTSGASAFTVTLLSALELCKRLGEIHLRLYHIGTSCSGHVAALTLKYGVGSLPGCFCTPQACLSGRLLDS